MPTTKSQKPPTTSSLYDIELQRRQKFSERRVKEIHGLIEKGESIKLLTDLCAYVTGSYGRGEASDSSDLDVFFIRKGKASSFKDKRLDQALAISEIESIRKKVKITKPLTERFLEFHYIEDIMKLFGGPEEDARNTFTARMLMLLEGSCIFNDTVYDEMLGQIVDNYFRDFADHQDDFKPVLLINDIVRFWKTMCLNYENARNEEKEGQAHKRFKLKYSRLITCYSMIASLISKRPGSISRDYVIDQANSKPWERLALAAAVTANGQEKLSLLKKDYVWFLNEAEDSERLKRGLNSDRQLRRRMFDRANGFNVRMYQFLKEICVDEDTFRFLAL